MTASRTPTRSPPDRAPAFFGDLHLDQILASLTDGREEYELAPFFYRPLHSVESVRYRHHVLRDLERDDVIAAVRAFADGMTQMRKHLALADKLHYARQQQRWFLERGLGLLQRRHGARPRAGGARARVARASDRSVTTWRAIPPPTRSPHWQPRPKTREDELAAITYEVHIRGNRVTVSESGGAPDVSEEVEHAFAKFRQGAVNDHRVRFREYAEMNHVEAQILDLVAKLFPEPFARLAGYCTRHDGYLDPTIARFDREVQFYVAYLEYIAPLKGNGLAFSFPRVSGRSKEISATATFDLSLAAKLRRDEPPIVVNDFYLEGPERVLVVSGPNNGGKTTFARTFGQLHYLASLGAGSRARRPSVLARSGLHPLRARRGHRDAPRANSRMSCTGSMPSWSGPLPTACSS